MPTLKALLFTIIVVLTILCMVIGSYIIYIFLIGSAIVGLFFTLRKLLGGPHG